MLIGNNSPFKTAEQLKTAIETFFDITPSLSQTKVHAVASDAFMQKQDGATVAEPIGVVLAGRTVEAVATSEAAAILHAYITARESIAHDRIAVLMYDLKNHSSLPKEHQANYRPVACDLGGGNIAMGFAAEEDTFTFAKDVLQAQSETIMTALNTLVATPAIPAQTQKLVAQVRSGKSQPVTAQQLKQALILALTAIASFSVAVKDLRKTNEKDLKSTSSEEHKDESTSPERVKTSKQTEQKKAEKKPLVQDGSDRNLEKKKAKQLEKQIQEERDEKRLERKTQQAIEILEHEEKIAEERRLSASQEES